MQKDDAAFADYQAVFLKNHPGAYYVEFNDFHCYRLEYAAIRYIGGFGEMSWVDATGYSGCDWDPVANGSAHAVEHMNEDHAHHVLLMVQVQRQGVEVGVVGRLMGFTPCRCTCTRG